MGVYMFSLYASPSRENNLRATLGSASVSLGLAYLMTSYVPIVENQFLHASVPLRLLMSVLLPTKYWSEKGTVSEEAEKEFLFVATHDGVLGLFLGWQLGRWDGRVAGSWVV